MKEQKNSQQGTDDAQHDVILHGAWAQRVHQTASVVQKQAHSLCTQLLRRLGAGPAADASHSCQHGQLQQLRVIQRAQCQGSGGDALPLQQGCYGAGAVALVGDPKRATLQRKGALHGFIPVALDSGKKKQTDIISQAVRLFLHMKAVNNDLEYDLSQLQERFRKVQSELQGFEDIERAKRASMNDPSSSAAPAASLEHNDTLEKRQAVSRKREQEAEYDAVKSAESASMRDGPRRGRGRGVDDNLEDHDTDEYNMSEEEFPGMQEAIRRSQDLAKR